MSWKCHTRNVVGHHTTTDVKSANPKSVECVTNKSRLFLTTMDSECTIEPDVLIIILKLRENIQYRPKITHAQELHFVPTRQQLLAPSWGWFAVGSCKTQELLCGRNL